MDFSDMDEMEADDALVDGHSIGDAFVDKSKPGAMIMDSVTRKWVGNETEFERFDAIVGNMAVGDILVPDDSVFSVSENVLREWTKDGEDHNKWLGEGARGEGIDIRMLAPLYSEVRARQRPQ